MTTINEKQQEKRNEKNNEKRPAARQSALPVLVGHVLATLPDSLARREEVLGALATFIPRDNPSGLNVRMARFHLQEHQKLRVD